MERELTGVISENIHTKLKMFIYLKICNRSNSTIRKLNTANNNIPDWLNDLL